MFKLSENQIKLQKTAFEFAKEEIEPRASEIDRTERYPWKM